MSIHSSREYWVSCDLCDRIADVTDDSAGEAIQGAIEAGWVYEWAQGWICPGHEHE